VKLLCIVCFSLCNVSLFGQLPMNEQQFLSRLKPGSSFPEKLLATRTAVFYNYIITTKELEKIQLSFQKTGIDAVVYFDNDLLSAGRDVSVSMAEYMNKREIVNIVLLQKKESGFGIFITEYNRKANFVEQDQPSYYYENHTLDELLKYIYRTAANSLKRENLLINDFPEEGNTINPIDGKRQEFFAIDLKVDLLAVPKFGNAEMDTALTNIMKGYPLKYKLTEPGLAESELRKQGYLFVLRFVHAKDKVAKTVMGYDMTKSESAIVSVSYVDKVPQLKNIHANAEIFKFYFKHIDSGNVFLGTKWDADTDWQQALINQIIAFKTEFSLN
jgi:hypothetical protein